MKSPSSFALIGAGPSSLYVLQHCLKNIDLLKKRHDRIVVFEKQAEAGPGMPYSKEQNSVVNLSNISSEELPELPVTFAAWLSAQDLERLAELRVQPPVKDDVIYPRLALGAYFHAQFLELARLLDRAGLPVEIHTGCEVEDIRPEKSGEGFVVTSGNLSPLPCRTVVIATGHAWPADPTGKYYASPWPIHKLVPPPGRFHTYPIGLLGASLSAVDVVNVLARHHGKFAAREGQLAFEPHPDCGDFKMVMHSADGLLSQLQFEQDLPLRTLYRHCTEDDIQRLLDASGRLPLARYFDAICRPVLGAALTEDGMTQEARLLNQPHFSFSDFAEMMTEQHLSPRPFEQMKAEFREASQAIRKDKPTHWKEVLDDLMYTLNFHAGSLPAEDHQELRAKILPFVMNVMAALPLESAKILMALHDCGRLEIVNGSAEVAPAEPGAPVRVTVKEAGHPDGTYDYQMFVDCTGQSTVDVESFPFPSLAQAGYIRPARASFADLSATNEAKVAHSSEGKPLLELGGIEITAGYQVTNLRGLPVDRLYDLAMPHVAGLRPYCYGLQACNEAARIMVEDLLKIEAPLLE